VTVRLRWVGGGEAEVVETDGQRVVVRSSRASPPGSPLAAESSLPSSSVLKLKVHGCRKEPDGWFRIEGRWVDLTRAAREELLQARERGGEG